VLARAKALWQPPDRPVTGAEFRVYRFNPPGTPNGRPVAFASSERPGHEARRAFDGSDTFWEAAPAAGTAGQFVGYDFGDRSRRAVAQVRVRWTKPSATPQVIRIEYSDDGGAWRAAGRFAVAPADADAADGRLDTFRLEPAEAHRFWRLVADRNPADHRFAVAELYFTPDLSIPP